MSIRIKMFLLALVITVCVSAMAVTAIISINHLSENFYSLHSHEIATEMSVTKLSRDLNYLSRLTRDIMLGGDYEKNMNAVNDIIEECSKHFEMLNKAAETEESRKLIAEAYADTQKWLDLTKTMMTALGKLPVEERYKAYKEYERVVTPPSMKARESFAKILESTMRDFESGVETFEMTIGKSATSIIGISLVAIIVIISSFIVILRTILAEIENRNRAEEALSASEKKARALLDGIDNCAYLIDPAGIILDINAKAAKLAGKHAVGPRVPVNVTEFEQVMINILKNAAQAMAEYGEPKPEISLSVYREGAMAVVKVSDNGPGMDEHKRKRIFEPFFTTKEVGAGTGLGLSVSYALITHNHKGIFTVDSVPGEGTCFTIKLPLKELEQG
jgi:signal transduction histidine kinase